MNSFNALVIVALLLVAPIGSAKTEDDDLLEMSHLLDQADKQDFLGTLQKARGCTASGNFACAESQLSGAKKSARGPGDRQLLASVAQELADAKEQARLKAAAERRRAEEEQQFRLAEARRAREAEDNATPSTASQILQFGELFTKQYAANLQRTRQEHARPQQALALADLSESKRRIDNLNAGRPTGQATVRPAPNPGKSFGVAPPPGNFGPTTNNSNGLPPAPQAQVASAAKPTHSGQQCGANVRCEAGDGYLHWCRGPDNGRPLCKSECTMSSGVIYHDTSLPNDRAYIPSGARCEPGCTVINPCE